MRAAQERLPPKKRDLPAAAAAAASSEASSGQGGGPSQAAHCYEESSEAVQGLPLDQYGLLYKVASFSPVVNVSPLPQAYGQLLPPHQPSAYSPLHYTQLPPALLQLVGSHYSVPYAVPPAFLPSPLLPSSAGLTTAASHIPHLVPYTPLLTDDAAPHDAFGKSAASSPLQHPPQRPDGPPGRIPIYYQAPHLPGGYSPFDTTATTSTEQSPPDGQPHPKMVTANGVLRTPVGVKEDTGEGRWTSGTDAPFIAGTEVSAPSQRSTPEMDLEVQRVVGVLSSPDYGVNSILQKDGLSPLNLSHRESERNPTDRAEKTYLQRLSTKSPVEQLCHRQLLKGMMMANGEQVSGSLQCADLDGPGRTSPGGPLDAESGPSQVHLPSHFMKGAIIQLATGELKRVEDLQTQDFVRSAEVSGGLKIDSSTVVDVQESPWQGFVTLHFVVGEQQSKVSIDVPPEHPFFVYGQGWSSCSPERTARLFSLSCHRLQVGDVCISISLQSLNGRLAPQASPQGAVRERLGRGSQGLREPQVRAGEKNLVEKGGVGLGSSQEPPHLEPLALHGWAGPSFQRFGEESWPPLLRPSFIPQEVKLSIEGRSNAGK